MRGKNMVMATMIIAALSLLLVGCNSDASSASSKTPAAKAPTVDSIQSVAATDPTNPVATTPVQTTPAPTAPPVTPAPTEPTTTEPEDELEILRVPDDVIRKDGTYLFRDNNKLYTFGGKSYYNLKGKERDCFIAVREVPVPVLGADDVVIGVSSSGSAEIRLTKVDLIGYTVPVIINDSADRRATTLDDGTTFVVASDLSEINIVDKDGEVVEDVRNLKYGEEYTVFWYSGTQYTEVKMVANCCYRETGEIVKIAGKVTKDGYATYDLSGVPVGLYTISGDGGLIRIE